MSLRASFYLCFVVTCWERADLLALVCGVWLWICSLSHWYPRSGVVLDCIVSWSLHPYLLYIHNSHCSVRSIISDTVFEIFNEYDALAVCRAQRGLPVGFLLHRYSVLFTVESLSLLYLLFLSRFICSRRWWVRCGTWLYQFLIFAPSLTFIFTRRENWKKKLNAKPFTMKPDAAAVKLYT